MALLINSIMEHLFEFHNITFKFGAPKGEVRPNLIIC